ncbi:MAG: hypothetical protein ACI9L9_000388 [Marivirga sp.]|jgi:hypothetical protein
MMLSKSRALSFSVTSHERYLDKLKARIDVVREGLVSNPLDVDLETTIIELRQEVRKLIFDKKWTNPLPISNWLVVMNFILSLNEVSASARKNNRSLNFSAQRSAFSILGYIFNHPQYLELCDKWSSEGSDNIFDVIQTMYSEVERQNYDPCLYGDLYAEGEWVSRIMGYMSFKLSKFSPSQEGLTSALGLWENLVSSSANSNPDRIPKLFENIKEATTSNLYGHLRTPFMYPGTEVFQSWKKMFEDIKPFRISTLKQHVAAVKVLHGEEVEGDWAVFNGAFGEGSQFMVETLPKIEDIWFECIQGSVFDSIAYMYGVCAFNDLWKELRKCWYLSQPEDADATYCDHQLFSRDPQAFSTWISDHIVPMDRTIHDRHDLKIHMAAACTVLIGEMLNTGRPPSFGYDSIAKAEDLERFIRVLKGKSKMINRESVKIAFGWDNSEANSVKLKVDEFLASELVRCQQHIANSLKNCIPNITINTVDRSLNKGDRELVYEAWEKTNKNFWSFFSIAPAIKVSFSKNILPEIIQMPFNAHESYYLSERSGKKLHGLDFGGSSVAASLTHRVAQKLNAIARSQVSNIAADSTWFISEDDWNTKGRDQLKARYGFDFHSDKSITVRGKQSFVVEKETAELVLHEWTFMPWSGGEHPVVVHGFTEFSEFTTGVSSLYYQFNVLNPSGIQKL